MNHRRAHQLLFLLLFSIAVGIGGIAGCEEQGDEGPQYLRKLTYNHPGLLVDLDVGFKSIPMPMDFDGDGDLDLLVSESGSYAESGVFYFENISGAVEMPVFRHGMQVSSSRFRLGYDGSQFEVSHVHGRIHVLTPDQENQSLVIYRDVPQNVFWDRHQVTLPEAGLALLSDSKRTQWKIVDFDGDGAGDLMCFGDGFTMLKNTGTDDKPVYSDPVVIRTVTGRDMGDGVYLKTLLADFDNDGDFDYIGMRRTDFVYFENTGSASAYAFADDRVVTADGMPILMESRATIRPTAVDWDGDGFVDIIAGDEDGKVSLLRNTGTLADGVPTFTTPRFLQQEARYVDFGALTTPRVVDWDGDGLDDIVSGNAAGHIGFFKNLGGDEPKWQKAELLQADGETIRILPPDARWGYVAIDVADWDQDGLLDILANDHNGNVVWFENVGEAKAPKLAAARPIEVQWDGEPLRPAWVPGEAKDNELLAPWRTSPYVMDFDGDGLNDLVMLDHEGYLAVYPRYRGEDGALLLGPPERDFVYPTGETIRLNQLEKKSSGRLKIGFVDWDGDGLKDLVFSSKPAVDWMKNLGMQDGKMVLQYMGRVLSVTLMGHTDGPVTPDWNRDGIPDLLVGTETGVFYYWQRDRIDVTTTMTTTGPQAPATYRYFKR